jgi:AraC-like DNA-binding protein
VTAAYLKYGRDLRLTTVELANLHIDIPLTGSMQSRCGRTEVVTATPRIAAVFTPGMPAELLWPRDCAQLCLMVDRFEVERELSALLGREVTRPVEFTASMDLTSGPGRTWMSMVELLAFQADRPDSPLRHPLAARNLQNMLISTFLLTHPHTFHAALTAPAPSAGTGPVHEAIELLESFPERPWSTGDLARHVSVSVRSLQEAFARTVETSPMAYLREVRLRRVHADLVAACASTATVTAIAGRWGFVHLGRFATAYRQKFGETPSTTLRAHP